MKNIALSFAFVFIFTVTFAQKSNPVKTSKPAPIQKIDRSRMPAPGPAPIIKLGNIQTFVLPNGLKVFLVENHKLPTVSYAIELDIHPAIETYSAGTADITGQLLTSGTTIRSKDQLDNDIDFIGASLEASSKGIKASSLKKHQAKLLELMSDVLINANFKQEELEKIKNQTLSGLASQKDDPDAISNNVKAALNFGKAHPYGEVVTEESIEKITLDDCNGYFKTYFRPNVSYLAVVGDVTLAEVKPLIEKYFSAWRKAGVPTSSFVIPTVPAKTRVAVVNKAGAVQSVINVTYPVDLKPNSDDVIKAKVLNTILGAGFSSRLFANLREKHGYTYGAYSSLTNDELAGEFSAYTKVRNAVTDSAINEMMIEMKRIRTEKVPQEELDGIKNFLTGNFAISLEEPETIAKFAINMERYHLPKDYYANYLKTLSMVTADDISEMARKYILPENANIIVVGDKEEISKKVEKFSAEKTIGFYDNYGNTVSSDAKSIPAGVSPKTVIDGYVKAIGGNIALSGLSDISIKMSSQVQGKTIEMITRSKTPDKFSITVKMGGAILQKQVYDGVKCKQSGMAGKKEITGDELENLKSQATINMEMQYEKTGYKLFLKGIEGVNGKDAYIMELISPSGKKSTEWYEVISGLKTRSSQTSITDRGVVTQTADFFDYKEVNGIKFPSVIAISGEMPMKFTVESIELNKGVKDTEFNVE